MSILSDRAAHTKNPALRKGFIALYASMLMIVVLLGFASSIVFLFSAQSGVSRNIVAGGTGFYAADAGLEDALLRIRKGLPWTSPYGMTVGASAVTVTISEVIGGSRTITSQATLGSKVRTEQVVYQIAADAVAFHYGAHIGGGGLQMDNSSKVTGNVFSNGNIAGSSSATITGTAQVAGTGNELSNVGVGGDAYANECDNSTIGGTLYASAQHECGFSSFVLQNTPPAAVPLPIDQNQINDWKAEAATGGVFNGNYTLSGSAASLGPKKITGNLTVSGSANLTITGTIWVQGNVIVQNTSQIHLDPAVYGGNGGVLISDGVITLQNSSVSSGSGQTGSYLMYLSTASSNPAINIKNSATADILYASNGWIVLANSTKLHEITGYGIHLLNSTQIQYDTGLERAEFTSGSGGSWKVTSWKEIP